MGRELDEILRQQIAQPANSCTSKDGAEVVVSFLDQVICPLYDIIAAVSYCLHFILFILLSL